VVTLGCHLPAHPTAGADRPRVAAARRRGPALAQLWVWGGLLQGKRHPPNRGPRPRLLATTSRGHGWGIGLLPVAAAQTWR